MQCKCGIRKKVLESLLCCQFKMCGKRKRRSKRFENLHPGLPKQIAKIVRMTSPADVRLDKMLRVTTSLRYQKYI